MDDPVRVVVIALVSGVVGAVLGFQVKTESIDVGWGIFWWGVGTIAVLLFLGVAAQGPISEDSEPMTKAIGSVMSMYGLVGAFAGGVGGWVGYSMAARQRRD